MKLNGLLVLALLSGSVFAEVKHIDNRELQQLLAENVPIIDIRLAEEWQQTGVVENSHLLTFFDEKGHYDTPKWLAALDKIAQKDTPFILICRTGNRTNVLSHALSKQLGYQQIYNVQKGITDWKREGLPVVLAADQQKKQ